jgi:hypothetical protein
MTYAERLVAVRSEFPGFTIKRKSSSRLMRLLSVLLFFNPRFMTHYVTTIGHWMWVPEAWDTWADAAKEQLLRHEAVHMRQQRRYSFPLYAFLYVFFPLPIGLAWFRARFEWEAYSESIRARVERYGLEHFKDLDLRDQYISYFTTGAYGWMWPFPKQVGSWYDRLLAELGS